MPKFQKLKEKVSGETPEHILATMFRQLCIEMDFVNTMQSLVDNRMDELNRGVKRPRSQGPLVAEILSERMSWGVYIKLITTVLKIDDFSVTTTVRTENHKFEVSATPLTKRTLMRLHLKETK